MKKFEDIPIFLQENLQERWSNWADKKVHHLHNDHLYEEPLEVSLRSQIDSTDAFHGNFKVIFDVGLSELDKVLDGVDKIHAEIQIELPAKQLAYMKKELAYAFRKGKRKKMIDLKANLTRRILHQIELRKNHLDFPVWNNRLATIITDELLSQLNSYGGKNIHRLSNHMVKVPVRFRFGIFALRYLWKRSTFLKNEKKALTFK